MHAPHSVHRSNALTSRQPIAFNSTLAAVIAAAALHSAIFTAACVPFTRDDSELRVLVFNIRAGKDAAGSPNLKAVADLVDPRDADVVLLQEVDRGTNRSGKVDQLQVLSDRSRLSPITPVLLGGDMNAEPDSQVHKQVLAAGLCDAWTECGHGDGFTFPADKPVKRIDYLFLTGSLACTSARVIETKISDHRPLLVNVVRKPNRENP